MCNKEIQRWRQTFPMLLFVDDQQIAKFVGDLSALLEPRWKREATTNES
jgi:hypothetical protein